ncbi:MAG: YraN family protein [Planctomycetota bacterium]
MGRQGERAAARYLRRRRYRILARNYRCVAGEIDLIASQAATIVFVEVKTRQPDEGQDDRLPVRGEQQGRITRAARYFLMHPAAADRPYRFDVISVAFSSRRKPQIEHFEDAFQPGRS